MQSKQLAQTFHILSVKLCSTFVTGGCFGAGRSGKGGPPPAGPEAELAPLGSSEDNADTTEDTLTLQDLSQLVSVFQFRHTSTATDQDSPVWLLSQVKAFIQALQHQVCHMHFCMCMALHLWPGRWPGRHRLPRDSTVYGPVMSLWQSCRIPSNNLCKICVNTAGISMYSAWHALHAMYYMLLPFHAVDVDVAAAAKCLCHMEQHLSQSAVLPDNNHQGAAGPWP